MKKTAIILICALALALSFAACGGRTESNPPAQAAQEYQPELVSREKAAEWNATIGADTINLVQFRIAAPGSEVAVIKTNYGDLRVILFRDEAPLAVENFVTLANNGYFNGMTFYRVVHNFVIESGKPADGTATSIYRDKDDNPTPFNDEFSLNLWNFRGALIMQNGGEGNRNSNTSEFMIVQAKTISQAVFEQMEALHYPDVVLEKYKEVGGIPGFDWRHTVFGQLTEESMAILDSIADVAVDAAFEPERTILIEEIRIETL